MRWSSSAPGLGRPIDVCLDEARESDLLLVIVALKYGSLPISYSQAEYEEGARPEKPCPVYVRDDEAPSCRNMSSAARTTSSCLRRGS